MMLRQGDILLVAAEHGVPTRATLLPRLRGSTWLSDRHRIDSPRAKLYALAGARFLDAADDVVMINEDHAPIRIAPGIYRVIDQREYTPVSDVQ